MQRWTRWFHRQSNNPLKRTVQILRHPCQMDLGQELLSVVNGKRRPEMKTLLQMQWTLPDVEHARGNAPSSHACRSACENRWRIQSSAVRMLRTNLMVAATTRSTPRSKQKLLGP
mgnify:CR=1 FL=1